MGNRRASAERAQRAAEERIAFQNWTAPVGTSVEVTRDLGDKFVTKTRSMPWKLGNGTPVIMVEGISGGYLLTRVRPVSADG